MTADAGQADATPLPEGSLPGTPLPAAQRWDSIVVGAGAAGLTVAHDLAGRGYRVLVLEVGAPRMPGPSLVASLREAASAEFGEDTPLRVVHRQEWNR